MPVAGAPYLNGPAHDAAGGKDPQPHVDVVALFQGNGATDREEDLHPEDRPRRERRVGECDAG